MKKFKFVTDGRIETEEDLEEAAAKIADPKKNGKTKVKKKDWKKANKDEEVKD